ncbi:MAG TPA: hypothetical protein VFU42_10835 [Candidatus Deferrimicrobiaceae bacterium]|nr:hypothetical protein [Candidatus Deferrimicrobiaceae bacterium]
MEGIILEGMTVGFGIATAGVLILVAAFTGVLLASMAEEEATGIHFAWAEWPLPETVEAAPPEERKIRLAA